MNKINEFFKKLCETTKFQRLHILVAFLTMFIDQGLGTGIVLSIISTCAIGLILEIFHTYAPLKKIKFLGLKFTWVNFKQFKKEIMGLNIISRNEFDGNNITYNLIGIGIYLVTLIIWFII